LHLRYSTPGLHVTRLRRQLSNPATAVALILIAVASWAVVAAIQRRSAPFARHLDAGRQYAAEGHARQAESEWEAALRLDPKSPIAWELLGELYTSLGNWQGGAAAFQALSKLTPNAPNVFSRLSICLLRNGNERDALTQANEELKRFPSNVEALIVSALVLSKMSDLDQEVACLQKILKSQPDNFFVLVLLAENLIYTHSYSVARPVIDHILRINPNHAEAYSLRGMAAFNEDRTQEGLAHAEEDFIKSLKNDPLAPFARLYLGKIYRTRGQMDKAVFQLETAQRLMPNKMDINFELAGALEQSGQTQKAAIFRKRFETIRDRMALKNGLQKKCAVDPGNFENHLQLGTLLLNEGDYSLARPYLEQAKSLNPSDIRVNKALQQLTMRMEGGTDPRDALMGALRSAEAGRSSSAELSHPGQER
jgi:cytochrome c-type biogenesis protein CcmH/NrfG